MRLLTFHESLDLFEDAVYEERARHLVHPLLQLRGGHILVCPASPKLVPLRRGEVTREKMTKHDNANINININTITITRTNKRLSLPSTF